MLVSLVIAAPSAAQQPIQPWGGQNPFHCELQQLDQGVDYPDPGADPLCVEFDKTQQNVAPSLGLVDFLAKEPARVAAAVPKCFYFQRDHWTGSVIQNEFPELWNWDGSYFFDKARALGGVHVKNFRIGGQPFDGTPYAPPEYQPYLEKSGGGGVWLAGEIDSDPACVAMVDTPAEAARIYRSAPVERTCTDASGNVGRRSIGLLRLGAGRRGLRDRLGDPNRQRRRSDRWCSTGGGTLGAVYSDSRAALVITSSPGHTIKKVGPRSRSERARSKLELANRFRARGARVMRIRRARGAPAYLALRKGRVRWLALRSAGVPGSSRSMRSALRAHFHR